MTKAQDETRGPDAERDRSELEQQLRWMREYRDWAIKALDTMPTPSAGSGVNLSGIGQRLRESAESAASAVEWLADVLDGLPGQTVSARGERPHHLRYVNMSITDAIDLFFETSQATHTEEAIIAEMEAGGAIIGRKRHVGEVKKSIEVNTRNGKYKNIGGKIGPSDWGKEKFR
jgi:hypothetical protein